jgi:hypothetical protein
MNRSAFLSKLIASVVIGKLPQSITSHFRKIYLLQCFIAGFRHYEGMQLLPQMKEGDLLAFVREPDNEHDSKAIALQWQGQKIGYIPAATNEMLSYLLDADALSLFAVITHLEKNAKPWENLAIAVYFVQEAKKDLPAHAHYLTTIEAPHYRTLKKEKNKEFKLRNKKAPATVDIFETPNRVINLDSIPEEFSEAKHYFESYYDKHSISLTKPGRYVVVEDDGIYSFMYEISEETRLLYTRRGEPYYEFFLR